ncbi:MAG: MBL fold metallo-hydrolase [Actinomycetota bacterium]|nr:MBL fold metallo-hydrolase [Actinomycetota bacterium]
MRVTFYGVRGSTPCPCDANARYGGNTSCVLVEVDDTSPPILLDLGTGLRRFGETIGRDEAFRGVAFLSHLHWDHLQGLPFFGPVLRPTGSLDIHGPNPGRGLSLAEAVDRGIQPPLFPVRLADFQGEIRFHELTSEPVVVGNARVTSASVLHTGPTAGYRIDAQGMSLAYIPDHQQPGADDLSVTDEVLELCDGVDLLIHDTQYDEDEFVNKADWGHCTPAYALEIARLAGVRELAMFHHDPSHDDQFMDGYVEAARRAGERHGVEVTGAVEERTIVLSPRTVRT